MNTILVTGGLGYIGSHTVVELVASGYKPVIIDNLSNSKASVLDRLKYITKQDINFEKLDLRDKESLSLIFEKYKIDAVIHFAGLKSVGESVTKPLYYYDSNLISTIDLCESMLKHNVKNLVFSSSATVYGIPSDLPLTESSEVGRGLTNPYGRTKYFIEEMLRDLTVSDNSWNITSLRYFNPIGAHASGLIGEDPNGIPNNLMPFVSKVASGDLGVLEVFGDDYDTVDGSGVRDYVHVSDLARGHIAAIRSLRSGYNVYNLGTGKGTSVLQLISAFENATGKRINYKVSNRRAGDVAVCYADASKAKVELGWEASLSIEDACKDSWRWQEYSSTQSE